MSISPSADGSVYVTGVTGGELDGQTHSGGYTDAFLIKYDSNGTKEWTKQFGTPSGDHALVGTSEDGAVYVAGNNSHNSGPTIGADRDAYLSKYNDDGSLNGRNLVDFSR